MKQLSIAEQIKRVDDLCMDLSYRVGRIEETLSKLVTIHVARVAAMKKFKAELELDKQKR